MHQKLLLMHMSCLASLSMMSDCAFADIQIHTATCRVDAVQQALSSLTSIPEKEQILLLHGNPLDPNKTLGAYKLPTVSLLHCCTTCVPQKADLCCSLMLSSGIQLTPSNAAIQQHTNC